MLKTFTKVSAVLGMALGASFVTPVEPVQAGMFDRNCGGLNQKTCIHVDPRKWCDAGLKQKRQRGRNICVRENELPNRRPGSADCGGAGEVTCISANPAKWCNTGFRIQYRAGRDDICVATRATEGCGGLNEQSCVHANPARWCNDGLTYKPRIGRRGQCIDKVTNAERIEVTREIIEELGDNNPLANLTKCLKSPEKLSEIQSSINSRSNGGINRVLRSCDADLDALRSMGSLSALNNGTQGGDRGFRTLSITVGASGAVVVAGAAGAGVMIELNSDPNARWFFTGGLGAGPKAEVVGDVTVGLSRAEIPSARIGLDHGIGAVVSGHVGVGLSGGIEFEGNTLDFAGISFGAGGGAGAGGAVYKTGAIFPFRDR